MSPKRPAPAGDEQYLQADIRQDSPGHSDPLQDWPQQQFSFGDEPMEGELTQSQNLTQVFHPPPRYILCIGTCVGGALFTCCNQHPYSLPEGMQGVRPLFTTGMLFLLTKSLY